MKMYTLYTPVHTVHTSNIAHTGHIEMIHAHTKLMQTHTKNAHWRGARQQECYLPYETVNLVSARAPLWVGCFSSIILLMFYCFLSSIIIILLCCFLHLFIAFFFWKWSVFRLRDFLFWLKITFYHSILNDIRCIWSIIIFKNEY